MEGRAGSTLKTSYEVGSMKSILMVEREFTPDELVKLGLIHPGEYLEYAYTSKGGLSIRSVIDESERPVDEKSDADAK